MPNDRRKPHARCCEGEHCKDGAAEVRLLPTGGDGNAILCKACFTHEILHGVDPAQRREAINASPKWEDLKVYDQGPRYCEPREDAHCSSKRSIAKRLGVLLNACERINSVVVNGDVVGYVSKFRENLTFDLRNDGFVVFVNDNDQWQVRCP